MTSTEEAAVEAACRAVRAVEATDGQFGGTQPDEVLSRRLDGLEWSSFHGRGYELLREVLRRVNGHTEPEGGTPELPWKAGVKYEERTFTARERLSRAL